MKEMCVRRRYCKRRRAMAKDEERESDSKVHFLLFNGLGSYAEGGSVARRRKRCTCSRPCLPTMVWTLFTYLCLSETSVGPCSFRVHSMIIQVQRNTVSN